ncbi:MAG: helix-turn-helix domain-containing protein [Clostridiales bacterium]|jgi:AraC-like DNA-binding protein/ligand-binding sensor protein|nr:helix-turn-helix domain-containing protein [Clostridiales bacterium]
MKFSTLEDFSTVTGVGVSVINVSGAMCYMTSAYERCAPTLSYVARLRDNEELCRVSAVYNSYQSKRFGGRFVYYCPCGFAYFSSPLIRGGKYDLSIIGGPVLMGEYEDYIDYDVAPNVSQFDREELLGALRLIPVISVRTVTALSEQLFINAMHLGSADSLTDIDPKSTDRLQEYIKSYGMLSSLGDDFQVRQEEKLIRALSRRDEYPARALLNSIIGQILFHCGKNLALVRNRMIEFTVSLSQAAMKNNPVDMAYIFGQDLACLAEIDSLDTMDDIVAWLNGLLTRFSECVFQSSDLSGAVEKAARYMRLNIRRALSAGEIAQHVYVSASHLGKVFKSETGMTPNSYLNKLRIDESKRLMADGSLTLMGVAKMAGFRDQSYFTKVFRKCEGVSPSQYRKRFGGAGNAGGACSFVNNSN